MTLSDILGDIAHLLLRALLIASPLLVWHWIVLLSRRDRGTNGIADATIISGVMVGVAALVYLIPGMALTWDAIARPNGVWDLTQGEFEYRALRFAIRAVPELIEALYDTETRHDLAVWLTLAGAIWLIRIAISLSLRRGRAAGRFLIAECVVFATSLYGTVYLGPLLIWSLNQLNFWAFLLLILLIQDWRHNEPPLVPRLASTLSGVARAYRPPANPVRVVD